MPDLPPRRAIFAALLALVYPGLGHAYLRAWGRAILWFGAVLLTATLLIPTEIYTSVASVQDIPAAWADVPWEATVGVAIVALFNIVDAYWTGKRLSVPDNEVRCPSCGRTVDEDLSFCHWCTTELSIEA